MNRLTLFLFLPLLLNSAVFAQQPPVTATLLLFNAKVYTVDGEKPWAEAIAIVDDKIVFVGSDADAKKWVGKTTEMADMNGRFILPGFQDAHVHPLEGVSLETFLGCDLWEISSKDPNPENWIELIKPCAEVETPHGWILGGGHSNIQLLTLDRPARELLDEAFPDRPAAFMEKSSHSMWVNSMALETVGITRDTPHPQGGRIFRDPETGEPNGILSDSAGDELMHFALARTPILQEARYEALLQSQDLLVSYGITSANNARVYWDRGNLDPWLRAEQEGTLKSRMVLSLWTYPHMEDEAQLAYLKSQYRDQSENMLRISQIKFYSDGVPSLNSAAVLQPYGYLIFDEALPMGLNYFTEERMGRYIAELERVGFSAVIHAIGDRGIHESLNAIEFAYKSNPDLVGQRRHYISHVGWVAPADIPRFKALDVSVDTQINFESQDLMIDQNGKRISFWDALLVNNLSDLNALPELAHDGARIVLSSDWDVASIDPLYSIFRATEEFADAMDEEDILPFAIQAYTLNPAYAMGQDALTGSIEPGKFADLVVLSDNLFEIPVDDIPKARVLKTFVGGKAVYQHADM
ncbi:MAG: amidohydrolase family protein [Pseudomonadota bacterium]